MIKHDEKKTAIKLLNKYADEYHLLQEEIKMLQCENLDLKNNLKINKEIIHGFFQHNPIDEKFSIIMDKLKEEHKITSLQMEKVIKEREELKVKLSALEQISSATITKNLNEIEKLRNQLFICENELIKKENTINVQQNKMSK